MGGSGGFRITKNNEGRVIPYSLFLCSILNYTEEMKMKILIGCEESQAVCLAFRELGHEAFSCDLQECSGGHPEWHIQGDVADAIENAGPWDLIGLHLPCTAVAVSGNRWYGNKMPMAHKRVQAVEWMVSVWELAKKHCQKVYLENPVGVLSRMSDAFPKPQYIQPWQFGHGETKKTGLWLRGLKELHPTDIVDGREKRIWKMPPSEDRGKLRSKTYPGIARAMAEQWG